MKKMKSPFEITKIKKRTYLQGPDLAHEVASLVTGDAASNHRTSNATGTAKRHLARDVHVGYVLILAEERQVEQNSERRSIRSQDDLVKSAIRPRLSHYHLKYLRPPKYHGSGLQVVSL
jgi:hypothetical protein